MLCLQAPLLVGSPPAELPVVVATTGTPTERDLTLYKTIKGETACDGYTIVPFREFRLAYPVDTCGMDETAKQIDLLRACNQLAVSGKRAVKVSSLSSEMQTAIRQFCMQSPQSARAEGVASSPGLTMKMGLLTTMHLENGGHSADLQLRPRPPMLPQLDEFCTPEAGDDSSKIPVPKAGSPAPDERKLTFLFPPDHRSLLERLDWTGQAQQYLLERCRVLKNAHETISRELVAAMMADDPDRYGRWPKDRAPKFADLSAGEQHDVGQEFMAESGIGGLGSRDASLGFLANARTTSVDTVFVLSAYFARNRTATGAEVYYVDVPLRCPITP